MSGHKQNPQHILADALSGWSRAGWRPALERIYAALPATACARQGACCGLLPPVQPVEMLAWLGELSQGDEQTGCGQAVMLVEHFLQNAAIRLPCPWALPDACARYENRFFGCRAYGLWSARAYEPRRAQSLAAAKAVQAAWQGMGVTLPPEVCAPPPDYCTEVRPMDGPVIDDAGLDELEMRLVGIGQNETWHGLLAGCGGDLSYLTAGLALGWQECLQAKVAVTRAILTGHDEQAKNMLAQAGQAARAWTRDLINGTA
jgi:hypothetical protein